MIRTLRTIVMLPIFLIAGAPATSGAAVADDVMMCRGPLKQKLFHRGELDKWSLGFQFTWAKEKVGFGLDLDPGQCGWATATRAEPSMHRLEGSGAWLHVDTHVTLDSNAGAQQKLEYVWTLRNEAVSSSSLFAFKIPRDGSPTQPTGYLFNELPSVSTGVQFH